MYGSEKTTIWFDRLKSTAAGRWSFLSTGEANTTRYVAEIGDCSQSLIIFGRKSDEEFTALARNLGKLTSRVTDLRNQTDSLCAVIGDRDDDKALSSAEALYRSSVDLVHSSAGVTTASEEQLAHIKQSLSAAAQCRDQFRRNHMMLNLVQMGIRIEAAKLEATDRSIFLNVAADISEIGNHILENTDKAFNRIDVVIAEAEAERNELLKLGAQLEGDGKQKIEMVQTDLRSLKSSLAPCLKQSEQILARFAEAGPKTMRVISSLQHQDIVRQQLEHVTDGFKDMTDHLRQEQGRNQATIEWKYLHQATRIQQAQLESARRDIDDAGQQVLGGLRSILESNAEMFREFSVMEDTAVNALQNCHVARSFEEEIGELSSIIAQSANANIRIAGLVDRIRQAIETFKAEVAHHEYNLKIVALNAQLAALRLPSAAALNRLGEETSGLSNANSSITSELISSLMAGLEELNEVKQSSDSFMGIMNQEKLAIEEGTKVVSRKLDQLVNKVLTGAKQIRQQFEPVFEESQQLVKSIDFPSLIETCFAPAEQLCARLEKDAGARSSSTELSASASAQLAQHQKRYTMHRENATHSAALERQSSAAVAVVASTDDIELFGNSTESAASTPKSVAAAAADDIELFGEPTSGVPTQASAVDTPDTTSDSGDAKKSTGNREIPPKAEDYGDGIELF